MRPASIGAANHALNKRLRNMTFDEVWKTLPIPGEYDAMDACDQGRWRGVLEVAFEAGMKSAEVAVGKSALHAQPSTNARAAT